MKTNKEKFQEVYGKLEAVRSNFASMAFPEGVPDTLWIQRAGGVEGVTVIGHSYDLPGVHWKTEPTRADIKRLEEKLAAGFEFSIKNAFIKYTTSRHGQSAFSLDRLESEFFTKKSDAERRAEEWRETYEPKEGEVSCKYCGKRVVETSAHRGVITSRMYKGLRSEFLYCNPRCASCDQMAHEG